MQKILYCVAMFTISVAIDDNVCAYDSVDKYYLNLPAMTKPTVSFGFQYHMNDMLNMKIFIKNEPQNVYKNVFIKFSQGVNGLKERSPKCNLTARNSCEFKQLLKTNKIFIELELSSINGFCTRKQNIIQGKRVSKTLESINNTPYYDMCLTSFPCVLEVDLSNTSVCRNRDLISVPSDTTTVEPDVHVNLNNNSAIETNATTTDNTKVTIISSAVGSVLVLIGIFLAIWTKRNCGGTPQLATTAPSEPFYLNALFRRECDQEIAEIEQHHYEEIGEHQNEQTENYYEEINS